MGDIRAAHKGSAEEILSRNPTHGDDGGLMCQQGLTSYRRADKLSTADRIRVKNEGERRHRRSLFALTGVLSQPEYRGRKALADGFDNTRGEKLRA